MANDMEMPDHWYHDETSMFVDMLGGDPHLVGDDSLQLLFHEALFDMELDPDTRDNIYNTLVEYMWDEYGIDFDDVFDWEAYREWYG
jgi:hypothetical protein